MKKVNCIILALILLLSLAACSSANGTPSSEVKVSSEPSAPAQSAASTGSASAGLNGDNPVEISMCGAFTGDYSEYGLGYQAATKIQVDKWNEGGGINGRKIDVKEYDEKGQIEEGVAIAQKVVVDKSNYGMVGHFWSIMEAGKVYQEYKVPMIGPAASTMGFSAIGDYIFRNNPTIKTETAAMLDCAKAAGIHKLGVYYLSSDWGEGSYEQLKTLVQERPNDGFQIVLAQECLTDAKDHSAAISKFASADVDAVMMFCFYDSVAPFCIQAGNKLGDKKIICGVNCYNDEFIKLGGANVEKAMAPMLSVKDATAPDMSSFAEQYKKLRNGTSPSSLDMQCYDSVGMLLTAIKNIGGANDHAAIRDQLANMTYDGVCGTVKFDQNRDAIKTYIPMVVKDGKWVKYEG